MPCGATDNSATINPGKTIVVLLVEPEMGSDTLNRLVSFLRNFQGLKNFPTLRTGVIVGTLVSTLLVLGT